MNRLSLFALVAAFAIGVVGFAIAEEMNIRGAIAAIDRTTGALTVTVDDKSVQFESEAGALKRNLGVGDKVRIKYQEVDGKKKATKITKEGIGC